MAEARRRCERQVMAQGQGQTPSTGAGDTSPWVDWAGPQTSWRTGFRAPAAAGPSPGPHMGHMQAPSWREDGRGPPLSWLRDSAISIMFVSTRHTGAHGLPFWGNRETLQRTRAGLGLSAEPESSLHVPTPTSWPERKSEGGGLGTEAPGRPSDQPVPETARSHARVGHGPARLHLDDGMCEQQQQRFP